MSTATQTQNLALSHTEVAQSIAAFGASNTIIVAGEIGASKSSLVKTICDMNGMEGRNFDCAIAQEGDVMIPLIKDSGMKFVPNEVFLGDKPFVLNLDEVGKAQSKGVMNSLLTIMMEHRIGDYFMPEGSIVFGTTNLVTDGVGDNFPAHAGNRVTRLTMRKPKSDEWIEWGLNNAIAPEVMAWVKEFPHCLASYLDFEDSTNDNPYIYNPLNPQKAFVSPRSLESASNIVNQRQHVNTQSLISNLAGTIGNAAARDMQSYLDFADSLPPRAAILAKPETAEVPDNPIACVILALSAVQWVERDTISNWMVYMRRMPREVQFMWSTNVVRSKRAAVFAVTNADFSKWCAENKGFA